MKPMVVMAAKAAGIVGNELLRFHKNRHQFNLQVSSKGVDGPVTQLDQYAEQRLIELLKKSYPKHSFLGEEFGLQEGKGDDAEWCWVIDPLDGTQNFVNGFPHFCISLAVQHKGVTQHAVIYDPVRAELFSARRGAGAFLSLGVDLNATDSFLDQRRIRVGDKNTLQDMFLRKGDPWRRRRHDAAALRAEPEPTRWRRDPRLLGFDRRRQRYAVQ